MTSLVLRAWGHGVKIATEDLDGNESSLREVLEEARLLDETFDPQCINCGRRHEAKCRKCLLARPWKDIVTEYQTRCRVSMQTIKGQARILDAIRAKLGR